MHPAATMEMYQLYTRFEDTILAVGLMTFASMLCRDIGCELEANR